MDSGSHSSPAVGNIDRDSGWEIVVGSNDGQVYAFLGTRLVRLTNVL